MIVSLILFTIFVLCVFLIMFFVSSYIALAFLIALPIAIVYMMPAQAYVFINQPFGKLWGVDVLNLHILLAVWCSLIALIIYSEFLAWYIHNQKFKE